MTPTQTAQVALAAARKAEAMSKEAVWYNMRFELMAVAMIGAAIAKECNAINAAEASEP